MSIVLVLFSIFSRFLLLIYSQRALKRRRHSKISSLFAIKSLYGTGLLSMLDPCEEADETVGMGVGAEDTCTRLLPTCSAVDEGLVAGSEERGAGEETGP